MTTLDSARVQMLAAGMPEFPPGHPVVTDRIIRYGTKKRAWYILRELVLRSGKVVVVGAFGIWGRLDPQKIDIDWQGFSDEERAETKRKDEEAERKRANKAEERAHLAANRAQQQWNAARWGGEAPYLKRKGVSPQKGLRHFADGTLIVPMIDYLANPPVLRGMQKIAPDGSKRYSSGMAKAATMCRFGKPRDGDPLFVVEGVATGLSVREALVSDEGKTPTVFVAFDCPNLASAGRALRKLFPSSPIVFCADDDWQTEGNPGKTKALEISGEVRNSTVCWPVWEGERESGWTDFNDLHASRGLHFARAQLHQALLRVAQGISTPKNASAKIIDDNDEWRARLLVKRGQLVDCRENVFWVLTSHPEWSGTVAFDEFANRIVKRKPAPWGGTAGEWTEADDARVGVWFVDRMGYSIKAMGNIMAAVMLAADEAKFHPVREYLSCLEWDQRPRVDEWPVRFLGCRHSEYVRLVGRFFLLNMIARVMDPGCIMRAVPVLEGPQERGKSTALSVLGGEYFSDTPFRVGEADACLAIQGVWVYEIGEMQQFGRAEAAAVKQFVSSRVDHYRPPYGRRHINVPRQTVFAGSINEATYLRDWTGNTRFHPIRCVEEHEIDTDGLRAERNQLLAEAYVLYQKGARRYPTREEAESLFAPEQEARMQEAAWEGLILDELERTTYKSTDVHSVLVEVVKVDPARITDKMMADVGRILARAGWTQSRPRKDGQRKRIYTRPDRPVLAASNVGDDDDIPF
jgi:putative DNA primase/helicase